MLKTIFKIHYILFDRRIEETEIIGDINEKNTKTTGRRIGQANGRST